MADEFAEPLVVLVGARRPVVGSKNNEREIRLMTAHSRTPSGGSTHVVDDGEPVLWAARQSDDARGEDWSIHCGAGGHAADDMRLVHLAHLVRAAPGVRRISDLGMDEEAWRADTDSDWQRAPLT
ncbi:MAG: hypothetical protein ACTHLJ_02725 [Angustibacter sp.]